MKRSPSDKLHDFSGVFSQLRTAVFSIEKPTGQWEYGYIDVYYNILLDVYAVQKVWRGEGFTEKKETRLVGLESKIDCLIHSL